MLKWLSLRLRSRLPQHEACMHLQGGMQASLLKVSEAYYHGGYRFVHCTDIRGYYRHIRKCQVMAQVARYVPEPALMSLVSQYVHYSVENGGEFHTPEHGIPRSCALSPLIGGSLLRHIDGCFSSLDQENYFYVRYMDDFLLFTRTRWQLRRAISQLAEYFELSGFERHPDKTQTGRLGRGFDWLGVWFDANGPAIAPRARENHREQCLRLYEQARRQGASDEEARVRVQAYVSRWQRWADRTLMLCLPGN
ncbi:reverse transcriptase domain-containing protein [Scandinavium sp.]|uniref:reverse transcriptase domain-containing protein n=1 Tax=Scandinavium sp. TaxID=2830653 RepID=UPI00289BBFD4|nr:reverse transcriptase domain-containing protein [Scandinavium sp.]